MNAEAPIDARRVRIEGNLVSFWIEGDGLHIQRDGHKPEHLSWQDAIAAAEGQKTFL